MKRFIIFITIITILSMAIAGLVTRHASAQAESIPMTEAHIERIRSNCIDAQSTLSQLHASDALLRVNRGQLYESISTKLMAPMNSRIALNRFDGTTLISLAARYENQLAVFRSSYISYEEAMSRILKINCTNQPVAFYDGVADTREKRKRVHEATTALHRLILDYQNEFDVFAKQFEGLGNE